MDILDDPVALAAAAGDSGATLAVNLRALLLLRGAVPDAFDPTLATFDRAATELGLDAGALAAVKQLGHAGSGGTMSPDVYGRSTGTG